MPRKSKSKRALSKRRTRRPLSQNGGALYDRIVNKLTGSNLHDGERHMLQYTKDGFKAGAYIGPGTDLLSRIKKGGVQAIPVSLSDKVSKAHDLRYSIRADTPAMVRKADKQMVAKIREIEKAGTDYKFNTFQAKMGILAKMKLEDLGLVGANTFTTPGGDEYSPEDRKVLEDALAKLEQEGYGSKQERFSETGSTSKKSRGKPRKSTGPNKWIAHVKAYQAKHNVSYHQAMKLSKASYKSQKGGLLFGLV